jgi:hypothetical protein
VLRLVEVVDVLVVGLLLVDWEEEYSPTPRIGYNLNENDYTNWNWSDRSKINGGN